MKLFLSVAVDLSAGCRSFIQCYFEFSCGTGNSKGIRQNGFHFFWQRHLGKKELIAMQMHKPKCCGKEMIAGMETGKFLELNCEICGDVVYLKKQSARPQMLDD